MLRQPWKCQPSCRVSENNMKNQKSALAQHSIKEMMHTQLNPANCYFWYISRLSGKKKNGVTTHFFTKSFKVFTYPHGAQMATTT